LLVFQIWSQILTIKPLELFVTRLILTKSSKKSLAL
jgi:hypothetical protein